MEEKGLRVNVTKTKVMRCRKINGPIENSGKWPVQDMQEGCRHKLHTVYIVCRMGAPGCSDISVKLQGFQNFRCMCCINKEPAKVIIEDEEIEQGVGFEMVDRFCYLGDMIGAGGGVEEEN